MFTRSDLSVLMDAAPPLGVSIFLPTHVRGAETRQDPIRLKNLVAEARDRLLASGLRPPDADSLLAPAESLIDDNDFWQHQDEGLALFLADGYSHRFKVPLPLAEQVLVGPGFHITPLLPILSADGTFHVLTITADRVRLLNASRFSMTDAGSEDLPDNLDAVKGEPDHENAVQAAPVARPNTGTIDIGNAQAYGDSPEDWRKSRLVEYVHQIAKTLQDRLASDRRPVVLVADAETGGQFQKLGTLGSLLAGVVETNPEALDSRELHAAAYAVMLPQLERGRNEAIERLAALLGSNDARAAGGIEQVVRAAYQGRVETLLLAKDETVWGRYDIDRDTLTIGREFEETGQDLIEAAAVQTLHHGGNTYVLSETDEPLSTSAVIMRY